MPDAEYDSWSDSRSEKWDRESDDRLDLRESLEQGFEEIQYEAKRDERRPENRKAGEDENVRQTAERAWADNDAAILRQRSEAEEAGQLRLLGDEIRRTRKIPLSTAVKQLLDADTLLRQNPEAGLQHLARTYSPAYREALEYNRSEAVRSEANEYFNAVGTTEAVERRMHSLISTGQFKRTGDLQKDLRALHAQAIQGLRS